MKKFLLLLILIGSQVLPAQNSMSDTNNVRELSLLKKFLDESPIHEPLNPSFVKFDVGKTKYSPTINDAPWGGYYMPFINGGLATRWKQCRTCHADTANILTFDKIAKMSKEEIAKLSPIEKLDIYFGNEFFWFTNNELFNRGPLRPDRIIDTIINGVRVRDTIRVESWEGFCNGMRAAGALLPEPQHPIFVKSRSKKYDLYVTFYPADLKALAAASYYYGEFGINIGENGKRAPNPGIFDMVLRGVLADQKRTFFIDVSPDSQKWNESVVSFTRTIVNDSIKEKLIGAPAGTYKGIKISVKVNLLGETALSDATTVPDIVNGKLVDLWICNYILYVAKDKSILGGEWERFYNTNSMRSWQNYKAPDYIWFVSGEGTDWLTWDAKKLAVYKYLDIAHLVYLSTK